MEGREKAPSKPQPKLITKEWKIRGYSTLPVALFVRLYMHKFWPLKYKSENSAGVIYYKCYDSDCSYELKLLKLYTKETDKFNPSVFIDEYKRERIFEKEPGMGKQYLVQIHEVGEHLQEHIQSRQNAETLYWKNQVNI